MPGCTSHWQRVFILLWNEKALQTTLGKVLSSLEKCVLGFIGLGWGGLRWEDTSFLRVCVHCKFSYLESGDHAFVSGVWSWWRGSLRCHLGAIFLSTAWPPEVARHLQVRLPSVLNKFISFADSMTSPPMTGHQNIPVQKKKVSSVAPVSANKRANVKGTMQTKQRGEPGRELTFISLSLCLGGLHHKIHIHKCFAE